MGGPTPPEGRAKLVVTVGSAASALSSRCSPPRPRGVAIIDCLEGTIDGRAPYFQWGFIQISLPNLVVIAVMILVFVLALVLPFPGHPAPHDREGTDG